MVIGGIIFYISIIYISIGIFIVIHDFYSWHNILKNDTVEAIIFVFFVSFKVWTWPVDMLINRSFYFNVPFGADDDTDL